MKPQKLQVLDEQQTFHVLNWGGPLFGVQKANVFTAPKMRLLQ